MIVDGEVEPVESTRAAVFEFFFGNVGGWRRGRCDSKVAAPQVPRALVRSPLLHRRGADAEIVEAFDGGIQQHGVREAECLLGGEEKVGMGDWDEKGTGRRMAVRIPGDLELTLKVVRVDFVGHLLGVPCVL